MARVQAQGRPRADKAVWVRPRSRRPGLAAEATRRPRPPSPGPSQLSDRTETRRPARSLIAWAARRLSGIRRNRLIVVCGPPKARSPGRAPRRPARRPRRPRRSSLGYRVRRSRPARTDRATAKTASGNVAGTRSFKRASRLGRSQPRGSGGFSKAAKELSPRWLESMAESTRGPRSGRRSPGRSSRPAGWDCSTSHTRGRS